jgi:ribokinase
MKNFRMRFPKATIVLTMGKMGAWYQDPSLSSPLYHGIYDVPVVDTTAAGDTFTGYFISCISESMAIPRALEISSMASSLAVSKEGAEPSIPAMKEVLTANLKQKR